MPIKPGSYNIEITQSGLKKWKNNLYKLLSEYANGTKQIKKLELENMRNSISKQLSFVIDKDERKKLEELYKNEIEFLDNALSTDSGLPSDYITQETITKLLYKDAEIIRPEIMLQENDIVKDEIIKSQEQTQEKEVENTKVASSIYKQDEIVKSNLDKYEELKRKYEEYISEIQECDEKIDKEIEESRTLILQSEYEDLINKLMSLGNDVVDVQKFFNNGATKFSRNKNEEVKEKFFSDKKHELRELFYKVGFQINGVRLRYLYLNALKANEDFELEDILESMKIVKKGLGVSTEYFKGRYSYYNSENANEKMQEINEILKLSEKFNKSIDYFEEIIKSNKKEPTEISVQTVKEANNSSDKILTNSEVKAENEKKSTILDEIKQEEIKTESEDKLENKVDIKLKSNQIKEDDVIDKNANLDNDEYFQSLLNLYEGYKSNEVKEYYGLEENEIYNLQHSKELYPNNEELNSKRIEKKEEIEKESVSEEKIEQIIDEVEEIEEDIETDEIDFSKELEKKLDEILKKEEEKYEDFDEELDEVEDYFTGEETIVPIENDIIPETIYDEIISSKDISSRRSIQKEIDNIYEEMLDSKRSKSFFAKGKSRPYGNIKEEVFMDVRSVFARINESNKFLDEPYADEFALRMFKRGVPQYMLDDMDEKLKIEFEAGISKYAELAEKGTFTDIEKENFEKFVLQPYALKNIEPKEKDFISKLKEETVSKSEIVKKVSHADINKQKIRKINKVK